MELKVIVWNWYYINRYNIRVYDGWMSGFYFSFNSFSVISKGWKCEHERLCAMKRLLGSGRISPVRVSNPGPRDPKLEALTAKSLLLYGYVLGRDKVLKCVWNGEGV